MKNVINKKSNLLSALVASALLAYASAGFAQTDATATPARIRATIEKVTDDTIEVRAKGGEKMTLKLAPGAGILGVTHGTIADIKSNAFIGSAAVSQADGSLRALEVTVFPAGMKSGEGHYPWDLGSKSTMTNGTVGAVAVPDRTSTMTNGTVSSVSSGRIITVKYPNGEKKIVVPDNVPIVNLEKGDRSLLIPGAHAVFFMSKLADGARVAARVAVGKDGVVPPM